MAGMWLSSSNEASASSWRGVMAYMKASDGILRRLAAGEKAGASAHPLWPQLAIAPRAASCLLVRFLQHILRQRYRASCAAFHALARASLACLPAHCLLRACLPGARAILLQRAGLWLVTTAVSVLPLGIIIGGQSCLKATRRRQGRRRGVQWKAAVLCQ